VPFIADEIGWECGAQWGEDKSITTLSGQSGSKATARKTLS